MTSNIIITGSGGMLGNALLEKLASNKNFTVFAITSQKARLESHFVGFDNVKVLGSLSEIEVIIDICINCSFPRTSDGEALAQAFNHTRKMIESLEKLNCQNFINISSQSVYNQSGELIQTELDDVNPGNLYAMSKFGIENLVEAKCSAYGIQFTNLRLGSLISNKFDQRMINRFYRKIEAREIIQIDNGEAKVSYLHIEDAVSGLERLVNLVIAGDNYSQLYNFSNQDWMYVAELAIECNNYAEQIEIGSTSLKFTEKISNYNNVIDSSKLFKDIAWEPEYKMIEIVHKIFNELSGVI